MKQLFLTFFFVFLLASPAGGATTYTVGTGGDYDPCNEANIEAACAACIDGDTVTILNGTYNNLGTIDIDDERTAATYFQAETPGEVIITGTFRLNLTGNYWVIQDFIFGEAYSGTRFIYLVDADNCKIRDNKFDGTLDPTPINGSSCIRLENDSDDNEIYDNHFTGLHGQGVYINHRTPIGAVCDSTWIHHNHFKDILDADCPANGEAMQLGGDNESAATNPGTIVELNLFENHTGDAGWAVGTGELISVKESYVTLRYNTIKDSSGFALRSNDYAKIYGNWFFGNNYYGIHVHGEFHKIYNNYFGGIVNTAITMKGTESTTTYNVAANCEIKSNTFVDTQVYAIAMGYCNNCDPELLEVPHDNVFKHNILRHDSDSYVMIKNYGSSDTTWTENIYWQTGSADWWNGANRPSTNAQMRSVNPDFDTRAISGPPDTLQVLDAGSSVYVLGTAATDADVTDDMDGHTRHSSTPDIGCDEWDAGAILKAPWVDEDDVGPDWMMAEAPPTPPTGLAWADFWWACESSTLDEAGGMDYSIGDEAGTDNSTPTYDTGIYKYGSKSLRTNAGGERVEFDADMIDEQSFFWGAWVNVTALPNANQSIMHVKSIAGEGANDYYTIAIRSDGDIGIRGVLNGNTQTTVLTTTTPFSSAGWHRVIVKVDHANTTQSVYVDSTFTPTATNASSSTITFTQDELYIGDVDWPGTPGTIYIDNVLITNDLTVTLTDFAAAMDLDRFDEGGVDSTDPTISSGKGYDASNCPECTQDSTITDPGTTIYFHMVFDEVVVLGGGPPYARKEVDVYTYDGSTPYAFLQSIDGKISVWSFEVTEEMRSIGPTGKFDWTRGNIELVGGTLQDPTGNNLNLTPPPPGGGSSLSDNSTIIIAIPHAYNWTLDTGGQGIAITGGSIQ